MAIRNKAEAREHIGHEIVCVGYALQNTATGERESDYANVAIECETCGTVLADWDN